MASVYCVIDPFAAWSTLASFDGLEDGAIDVWQSLLSLHPALEDLGGARLAPDGETLQVGSFWPRQAEAHARFWLKDEESFVSDPIDEALENGGLLWMVTSATLAEPSDGFSLKTPGNPPSFRSWKSWWDDKHHCGSEAPHLIGGGRLYVAAHPNPGALVVKQAGVAPSSERPPDGVVNPIVVRLDWDGTYVSSPTNVGRVHRLLESLLHPGFLLDIIVEADEQLAARFWLANRSWPNGASALRQLWSQNERGPSGLAATLLDMFGGSFEIGSFGSGKELVQLGWREPITWHALAPARAEQVRLSRALSSVFREWAGICLLKETCPEPSVLPSGVHDRIALTLAERPVSIAQVRRELNLNPAGNGGDNSWLDAVLATNFPFPTIHELIVAAIVSAANNLRAAQDFWSKVYAILGPQSILLLRLPPQPELGTNSTATWEGSALDLARSAPLGTRMTLLALYDGASPAEDKAWSWPPCLRVWLKPYYEGVLTAGIDSTIRWLGTKSARVGSFVLGASVIGSEAASYTTEPSDPTKYRIY
ncbi:hypothetical protein ACVWWG_007985 [Bradyrhizobium sp. LB7.2]